MKARAEVERTEAVARDKMEDRMRQNGRQGGEEELGFGGRWKFESNAKTGEEATVQL